MFARTLDVAFVHGHLYITPCRWPAPRNHDEHLPHRWCGCCRGCTRRSVAATRRPGGHSRSGRGAPSPSTGSPSSGRVAAAETERRGGRPVEPRRPRLADHLRACRQLVTGGYRAPLRAARRRSAPGRPADRAGARSGASTRPSPPPRSAARRPRPAGDVSRWMLVTGYDLDAAWNELGATHALGRQRPSEPPSISARSCRRSTTTSSTTLSPTPETRSGCATTTGAHRRLADGAAAPSDARRRPPARSRRSEPRRRGDRRRARRRC